MFELMLENEDAKRVNINDGVKYQVISASGLNPPSASIFTAKSPNRKGSKYNGSTLDERNIVITIKILGDVEYNRNALYEWVDTEQYVKIHYRNELKKVYCEGHVKECDIDLFVDNEMVNLAVLCEVPYWRDVQEIKADISAILKQFTFPFSIDGEGVPFSTIRLNNSTHIFNNGAETGVIITAKCLGDVENLAIYDARDTTRAFRIKATLKAGWVLVIDSENSPRTVKVIKPDGSTENYLKYTDSPTWFTLKKGDNYFAHAADNGTTNVELTIGYTAKWLGV